MSAEVIMALNLVLTGLAIYALIRLVQRRQKRLPKRPSDLQIMEDKISKMVNELKELEKRLEEERKHW